MRVLALLSLVFCLAAELPALAAKHRDTGLALEQIRRRGLKRQRQSSWIAILVRHDWLGRPFP
jgi:hypothetical protein